MSYDRGDTKQVPAVDSADRQPMFDYPPAPKRVSKATINNYGYDNSLYAYGDPTYPIPQEEPQTSRAFYAAPRSQVNTPSGGDSLQTGEGDYTYILQPPVYMNNQPTEAPSVTDKTPV